MDGDGLMKPFWVLAAIMRGVIIGVVLFVVIHTFCSDTYDLRIKNVYVSGDEQRAITVNADVTVFGIGVGIKSVSEKREEVISKEIFSLIERYKDKNSSDDFEMFGNELKSVIREFGEEYGMLIHINDLNYWFGP